MRQKCKTEKYFSFSALKNLIQNGPAYKFEELICNENSIIELEYNWQHAIYSVDKKTTNSLLFLIQSNRF